MPGKPLFNPSDATDFSFAPVEPAAGTPTHSVEPELVGATLPRVARPTKRHIGRTRLLWNAMFVCIGVLGFLWRRDYETWNALIKRGVVTDATVYNKRVRTGKSTTYLLDYRFFVNNVPLGGSQSVSHSDWDRTALGSTWDVTYLPEANVSKWQVGEVSARRRDQKTWEWVCWGTGITAMWATLIGISGYTVKKQLRLLQHGNATVGRVTSGRVIHRKTTTYRLFYSFSIGESEQSGAVDVDKDRYHQVMEGSPYFTVLYDPANPSNSMPYFNANSAYLVAA